MTARTATPQPANHQATEAKSDHHDSLTLTCEQLENIEALFKAVWAALDKPMPDEDTALTLARLGCQEAGQWADHFHEQAQLLAQDAGLYPKRQSELSQ